MTCFFIPVLSFYIKFFEKEINCEKHEKKDKNYWKKNRNVFIPFAACRKKNTSVQFITSF